MKPKVLKSLLFREINSLDCSEYAKSPDVDFTRSRKLPFYALITTMLRMEGKSMGNELISMFPKASGTPKEDTILRAALPFRRRSRNTAGCAMISIST